MSHKRQALRSIAGQFAFLLVTLSGWSLLGSLSWAQQPDSTKNATAESSKTDSPESTEQQTADENDPAEIAKMVAQLGARSFREREAATAKLLAIGPAALPVLRQQQMAETDDAELRKRIEIVTTRLINDDFEARATAFLEGKEDAVMPGWEYVKSRTGERVRHREIFVELSRRHPAVVMLLDGSADDRAEALKILLEDLGPMMTDPNFADALCLLLLSSDDQVDAREDGDQRIYALFNHYSVKQVADEPEFREPVLELLNQWVLNTADSSRYYGLFVTMQWKLKAAPELAKKILATETNPDILALTFRMLATLGTAKDAVILKPFFDDKRLMPLDYFYTDPAGRRLVVKIGDLAMATAAIVNDKDPKSLGFPGAQVQGNKMFNFETMGFPEGEVGEEARKRVRESIEELLEEPEPAN